MTAAACFGDPEPFDHLIDHAKPDRTVVRLVLDLCGSCPIQEKCWERNAEQPWLLRIKDPNKPRCSICTRILVAEEKWRAKPVPNRPYATHTMHRYGDACNSCQNKEYKDGIRRPPRKNADVMAEYLSLREQGYDRRRAAAALGMTRNALDKTVERWNRRQKEAAA